MEQNVVNSGCMSAHAMVRQFWENLWELGTQKRTYSVP